MLLWDIIRDWFVVNIWGGYTSTGDLYSINLGRGYNLTDLDTEVVLNGNNFFLPIQGISDEISAKVEFIAFSDWLSTTSTIIVLVILCIIFGLMVRWLFRLTSGLLQGR